MKIEDFYANPDEKPLDHLVSDGGFCGIFRTIGCIGDSLASGEFESRDENGNPGYHDYYEYSWGQYLARMSGSRAINFSRGGMTAKEFWDGFGDSCGCWKQENVCQAYIVALGVNDLRQIDVGTVADIDIENPNNCAPTFAGYLGRILLKLRRMQPKSRLFLVTMPRESDTMEEPEHHIRHNALMYAIAELLEYTYVIDLAKYGPAYDMRFKRNFFLGGHLNAAGYLLTARMFASYIDYIIRHNPDDFTQIGFVGTPYHHRGYKW